MSLSVPAVPIVPRGCRSRGRLPSPGRHRAGWWVPGVSRGKGLECPFQASATGSVIERHPLGNRLDRHPVVTPQWPTAWAAYAACVVGVVFGIISFYWGSGGTLGLDTIGGKIEQMARAHDTAIFVAVWAAGVLKVVGAVLALALIRPWGRRLARRPVVILGWLAAIVLTLYGAVLVVGDALGASGAVTLSKPVAAKPLLWHLWVWDMLFLVWGILFAVAIRGFTRSGGSQSRPAR